MQLIPITAVGVATLGLPHQEPELKGPYGWAWQQDLDAIAAAHPGGPPRELTVSCWIVHAPNAHPVWHSYLVARIRLREMPGVPAPLIYLQGATKQ